MANTVSLFLDRNVYPLFSRIRADRSNSDKGDLLDLYELLEAYYQNNGLYERAAAIYGSELQPESLAALRTPAQRVIEFYAATIWPGDLPDALPIITDNEAIIEPIQQLWRWSNWATKKQLAIRRFAMFGDLFLKVSRRDMVHIDDPTADGEEPEEVFTPSSVFLEVLNPKHIPKNGLVLDERGNVIYIRIDVPKTRVSQTGNLEAYTHTEIWTRELYRRFEHKLGFNANLNTLGQPIEEVALSEFGIDFIPIVYAPFRQIDDMARGAGAYTLALGKIDELNRMATRLHYLLFRYNKAVWAMKSNTTDSAGRPVLVTLEEDSQGEVLVGDDTLLNLPGNSDLTPLVPNLNYAQYLDAINAQAADLQSDLPELAYSGLRDRGDLSGRAIELLLGDAIARANEARGAAEEALIRAQKMALTMGQAAGLFKGLGSYEAGSFDHRFATRPIIPTTELDRAEVSKAYREVGLAVETVLLRAGWQEEEIAAALEAIEEEAQNNQANQASAILDAARQFDSGAASNGLERPEPEPPEEEPAADPNLE